MVSDRPIIVAGNVFHGNMVETSRLEIPNSVPVFTNQRFREFLVPLKFSPYLKNVTKFLSLFQISVAIFFC